MNKSQLDNFIRFCFNFHRDADNPFFGQSPDYIMEKWNKYIGIRPIKKYPIEIVERTEYSFFNNMEDWISIWTPDLDFIPIEIIVFLSKLNNKSIGAWRVSSLVDAFEESTGIKISDISNSYDNLHKLLVDFMEDWINHPVILRDYNLVLLTSHL